MEIADILSLFTVISYRISGMLILIDDGRITRQSVNLLRLLEIGSIIIAQLTRCLINKRKLEKDL